MFNLELKKKLLLNYSKCIDKLPRGSHERKILFRASMELRALIGREGGFNNTVKVYEGMWLNQLGFKGRV